MTISIHQILPDTNNYTSLTRILTPSLTPTAEDTLKEDPERPTWQLWKDDPNCSHYYTRFGKDLTPVQMVSVPCSGSNWLRYLVEGSTGFFTGSIYNDSLLYKEGENPVGLLYIYIDELTSLCFQPALQV